VPDSMRSPKQAPSAPLASRSVMALWLVYCVTSLNGGWSEQYADAIVPIVPPDGQGRIHPFDPHREPNTGNQQDAAGGAAGSSSGGSFSNDDDDHHPSGRDTLWERCDSHRDCGRWGDLCLLLDGEARCGMACNWDRDCPTTFDCVDVGGRSDDIFQCVPRSLFR